MAESSYPLNTPLADLPSVGEMRAAKLAKLGLRTAKDALLHFPRGYKDFSGTHAWGELAAGAHAAIAGEVIDVSSRLADRRRESRCGASIGSRNRRTADDAPRGGAGPWCGQGCAQGGHAWHRHEARLRARWEWPRAAT